VHWELCKTDNKSPSCFADKEDLAAPASQADQQRHLPEGALLGLLWVGQGKCWAAGATSGFWPFPLQVNKATLGLLKRVEPYVAFGYPNLKSVRELIYKRGFAKVCHAYASGAQAKATWNRKEEPVAS
jgi:hypothetical protein